MSGVEQRKEIRFPAHVLPEEYRTFSILLSQGKTATVKTVDASRNGFGFTAHLSSDNFILGSKIVLYPFGESRPVYGIIVYAQPILADTRVGVILQHLGGYEKYVLEIDTLEKNKL